MKRIVAKEFLLLVACMVAVLIVALFGWARNAWLTSRIQDAQLEGVSQSSILDSLEKRTKPVRLPFVDVFDSAFVRDQHALLAKSRDWHDGLDPLTDFSRVYVGAVVDVLIVANYPSAEAVRKSASLPLRQGDLESLGRTVKRRFPDAYNDLPDALVGKKAKQRFPIPFAEIKDVWVPPEADVWTPPVGAVLADPKVDPAGTGYDVLSYDEKPGLKPWERYETRKHIPLPEAQDIALLRARLRSNNYPEAASPALDTEGDDTTVTQSLRLALARALMDSSSGYAEMKSAHNHLRNQHVLNCTFDALFYTLQRKPVPPAQETLDALTKQRRAVDELRKEENGARAGLWSAAKQWAVVKWAAIVLLVLVYPLRLLVLGTRWAFRTLRT